MDEIKVNKTEDIFFTDYFRILSLMYEYQIIREGIKVVPITQVEISEKLEISKVTINHMMKELISRGYVVKEEGKLGKYYLSSEAQELVVSVNKRKNNKIF